MILLSVFIYKDNFESLQDIWLENWKPEDLAYFIVISNGWSCDVLELDWLEKVFH